MANECILVVEDEEDILELVEYNLVREGYKVEKATTGEDGLLMTRQVQPDMVLLDLMLPGMNGLKVCRRIKMDEATRDIPVMMITAKGEESDVVEGLEAGADDYLVKPFSHKILLARVRAVLRRKQEGDKDEDHEPLRVQNLVIHPGRHEVLVDGDPADLTFSEFRILHYLAKRPGWVFTRRQIVESVRGGDHPVTERSVDVLIVGLRKKLGNAGALIETVRGVGYRFQD